MTIHTLSPMVLAVAVLAGFHVPATGQNKTANGQEEKRFTIALNGASWQKVFEWYQDVSGLVFFSPYKPPGGQFTYTSRRKHTLSEITDIINEQLATTKYVLIRRETSFLIIPREDLPDNSRPPRRSVKLEDLNRLDKNEVVTVVFPPFKKLVAEQVAQEVKERFCQKGDVVFFNKSNRLLVSDRVESLRMVLRFVQEQEKRQDPK